MSLRSPVLILAILAFVGMSRDASAQNPLPQDAKPTCTVTSAEFAKWFTSGMIKKDGQVNPADSLNFVATPCNFYKWSWQMFMWTTSPQHTYGGGSLVLNSPVFYDVSPAVDNKRTFIQNNGSVLKFQIMKAQINHKGKFVRIKDGKLVETEEGQATNDALMAQTGSLVFYGVHTNDVYAYFLTGNKDGEIKPTQTTFPANKAQMDLVAAFAAKHKKKFPDPNALVMELKTSWVEVSKLPNADTYIQLTAEAPIYTKNKDNTKWTPTGKFHQVKLALVGMHVVGTVNGHPEMAWATFEHINNAPNDKYSYENNKNKTVSVAKNTAGSWLFSKKDSKGPFNISHMSVPPTGIEIIARSMNPPAPPPPFTISPSDTLRSSPWGQDPTAADFVDNNTQIISLNNSVLSHIPAGDLRKNYVLIGTTWTKGGLVPGMDMGAVTLGSKQLANATMETYAQPSSCFDCHAGSKGNGLGLPKGHGFSHIYGDLQGLKLP